LENHASARANGTQAVTPHRADPSCAIHMLLEGLRAQGLSDSSETSHQVAAVYYFRPDGWVFDGGISS
jgi:hypothetical protein